MPLKLNVSKTALCDRCGVEQEYNDPYELSYWKHFKQHKITNMYESEVETVLCPKCVQDYKNFMAEKLS